MSGSVSRKGTVVQPSGGAFGGGEGEMDKALDGKRFYFRSRPSATGFFHRGTTHETGGNFVACRNVPDPIEQAAQAALECAVVSEEYEVNRLGEHTSSAAGPVHDAMHDASMVMRAKG